MNLFIFNSKSKKIKIVYLIIFTILLFIFLDRAAYLVFKNISDAFYETANVSTTGSKISKKEKNFYNTLILGSSRTKQGLHPWYLKKYLGLNAFTRARAGHYLKYNYRYYKLFKKKHKVPEYLFYGIDYFIFNINSSERRLNKLSTIKKNSKQIKSTENYNMYFNPIHYPSLLVYNKKPIDTFTIDLIDHLAENSDNKEKISLISDFRGQKRTIPPGHLKEPLNWKKREYIKYPGKEGKYLDLLLKELENDKVKVFFVIFPSFINVYKTNYQRELFLNDIKSIVEKYSNITILSYNMPDDFELSNPRYFRDGSFGKVNSHLSYYGAKVFNKKLCEDIRKLPGSPWK
ncbi:MAG: hypothetical protein ABFR36_07195 [Acidobacteriota bacterium]